MSKVRREDPRRRERGRDIPEHVAAAILLGALGTFTTFIAQNDDPSCHGRWRCVLEVAGLDPVVTYQDNYSDTVAFLRQAGWCYVKGTTGPKQCAWLRLASPFPFPGRKL